jgi:hypothetical protein
MIFIYTWHFRSSRKFHASFREGWSCITTLQRTVSTHLLNLSHYTTLLRLLNQSSRYFLHQYLGGSRPPKSLCWMKGHPTKNFVKNFFSKFLWLWFSLNSNWNSKEYMVESW